MPCSQKLLTLLLIISHLPNKQSRPMRARGLKLDQPQKARLGFKFHILDLKGNALADDGVQLPAFLFK